MLLLKELEQDGRYSPAALAQVGTAVARSRADARRQLAAKLPTGKLERLARRLERAAQNLESSDARDRRRSHGPARAWLWALDARVTRRAARARSAIQAASAVYVPGHLHGVRVALKKLRYAAELSAEARRQRTTADIAALKAAQDLLGRLHDWEVLLEHTRRVQASLSPPDLAAWRDLGSLVHVLEDDCRRLHALYVRDRSKLIAIVNRMQSAKLHSAPATRAAG